VPKFGGQGGDTNGKKEKSQKKSSEEEKKINVVNEVEAVGRDLR